jgi:hypothetical protein
MTEVAGTFERPEHRESVDRATYDHRQTRHSSPRQSLGTNSHRTLERFQSTQEMAKLGGANATHLQMTLFRVARLTDEPTRHLIFG